MLLYHCEHGMLFKQKAKFVGVMYYKILSPLCCNALQVTLEEGHRDVNECDVVCHRIDAGSSAFRYRHA